MATFDVDTIPKRSPSTRYQIAIITDLLPVSTPSGSFDWDDHINLAVALASQDKFALRCVITDNSQQVFAQHGLAIKQIYDAYESDRLSGLLPPESLTLDELTKITCLGGITTGSIPAVGYDTYGDADYARVHNSAQRLIKAARDYGDPSGSFQTNPYGKLWVSINGGLWVFAQALREAVDLGGLPDFLDRCVFFYCLSWNCYHTENAWAYFCNNHWFASNTTPGIFGEAQMFSIYPTMQATMETNDSPQQAIWDTMKTQGLMGPYLESSRLASVAGSADVPRCGESVCMQFWLLEAERLGSWDPTNVSNGCGKGFRLYDNADWPYNEPSPAGYWTSANFMPAAETKYSPSHWGGRVEVDTISEATADFDMAGYRTWLGDTFKRYASPSAVLNALDKCTNVAISEGGLKLTSLVTNTADGNWARANVGHSSGKFYAEMKIRRAINTDGFAFGLSKTGLAVNAGWLGEDANGFARWGNGNTYSNNALTSSFPMSGVMTEYNRIAMAWDIDNLKAWWKVLGPTPGNWNANGTANPATNTNGEGIPSSGTWYLTAEAQHAGNILELVIEDDELEGAVPSGFVALGRAAQLTYTDGREDGTDTTSYSFTSVAFSTAEPTRRIVVCVGVRDASSPGDTTCTMTVGGVSATQVVTLEANSAEPANHRSSIFVADVPTGTSGTIVLTFSQLVQRVGIQVYALHGARSGTPYATESSSADPASVSLAVPHRGCALGYMFAAGVSSPPTNTWTELTEDDDTTVESNSTHSSAHKNYARGEGGDKTITVDPSVACQGQPAVFASWR